MAQATQTRSLLNMGWDGTRYLSGFSKENSGWDVLYHDVTT